MNLTHMSSVKKGDCQSLEESRGNIYALRATCPLRLRAWWSSLAIQLPSGLLGGQRHQHTFIPLPIPSNLLTSEDQVFSRIYLLAGFYLIVPKLLPARLRPFRECCHQFSSLKPHLTQDLFSVNCL